MVTKGITSNRINAVIKVAVLVSFFAVSACGCGAKKSPETKLTINKDGMISSVIVESFGEDYYDLSELEDMANDEISYYNSEYTDPRISLDESGILEDGRATLTMNFSNYIDFAHFNQVTFFYGTVAEASDKGFSVSGDLVDSQGVQISLSEIEDISDRHIIITGDKAGIIAPYKISYMTKGVVLKDKKEAELSGVTQDIVQLLLSK